MNYKIIETDQEFPDVLVYRDRNEEGSEVVHILAVGQIEEDGDSFAEEVVGFPNGEAAQQFVQDFSKQSAEIFCERNNIKY